MVYVRIVLIAALVASTLGETEHDLISYRLMERDGPECVLKERGEVCAYNGYEFCNLANIEPLQASFPSEESEFYVGQAFRWERSKTQSDLPCKTWGKHGASKYSKFALNHCHSTEKSMGAWCYADTEEGWDYCFKKCQDRRCTCLFKGGKHVRARGGRCMDGNRASDVTFSECCEVECFKIKKGNWMKWGG